MRGREGSWGRPPRRKRPGVRWREGEGEEGRWKKGQGEEGSGREGEGEGELEGGRGGTEEGGGGGWEKEKHSHGKRQAGAHDRAHGEL